MAFSLKSVVPSGKVARLSLFTLAFVCLITVGVAFFTVYLFLSSL